jgi:hypothetical protein
MDANDTHACTQDTNETPDAQDWISARATWFKARDLFVQQAGHASMSDFATAEAWDLYCDEVLHRIACVVAEMLHPGAYTHEDYDSKVGVRVYDVYARGKTIILRTNARHDMAPMDIHLNVSVDRAYTWTLEERALDIITERGHEIDGFESVSNEYGQAVLCKRCGAIGRVAPNTFDLSGPITQPCTPMRGHRD